jgi:hypothetical protein
MMAPCDSHRGQSLAAVTAYFNPFGSRLLARNILLTRASIEARNVPFFVAEGVFPGQKPFLPAEEHTLVLRATDLMWQKERLLNLVIASLPDRFDQIAWIDGDILFPDSRWAERTAKSLEEHVVVQLFDEARMLNRGGRVELRCEGIAYRTQQRLPKPLSLGVGPNVSHPGLAWAARREFLADCGLFDRMIVGGGDSSFVAAAYGAWDHWHVRNLPGRLQDSWRKWAVPVHRWLNSNVGHVSMPVIHLWHGEQARRKYVERLEMLRTFAFDPAQDLAAGIDGLWEWSSEKNELHGAVVDYFHTRETQEEY